jgi:hypothetical protein
VGSIFWYPWAKKGLLFPLHIVDSCGPRAAAFYRVYTERALEDVWKNSFCVFTTVTDQTFDTANAETFQMQSKHYLKKEGWHKYVF